MNNSDAIKAIQNFCDTERQIRDWLVAQYMPHEILEMTPLKWVAAIRFVSEIRAGINWACGDRKFTVSRNGAKYLKVRFTDLANAFPQDWYVSGADEVEILIPELSNE